MCDGSSIDGMSDDLNLKKLTGFQLCGSKIKGAVDELKADMTGANGNMYTKKNLLYK